MRKCFRCGAMMEEGFRIKAQRGGYGIEIVCGEAFFPKRIGIPKAAVCFSCGEVSLYIDLVAEDKEAIAYIEKQEPAMAGSSFHVISGGHEQE